MKTRLMRVPCPFYDEVDKNARAMQMPKTKFLERNGVRIMRNARTLTDLLFRR